uniref:Serine aminopeptidase S33 domain-containing protein n=1 Tax=Quercus lobata TaxID=97700 RepID=A0A7N2LR37_QUELO
MVPANEPPMIKSGVEIENDKDREYYDSVTPLNPVPDASESSPYGDLTREEFYKNHQILHKESFMLNQQNMKICTQSWRPNSTLQLKGLVAMLHGYNSESSWLFELTAVAIAKAGFLVCAIDLQGHGYSDGLPGHIPNIEPIVCDCVQFFDSIKVDHPKLLRFIYGESLGGAIAILVCLKQKKRMEWLNFEWFNVWNFG